MGWVGADQNEIMPTHPICVKFESFRIAYLIPSNANKCVIIQCYCYTKESL